MTNVELVKQMYTDLASGNAPAALSLFDPAIEWRECQDMPFVEDDGVYQIFDLNHFYTAG
jgi:hypothetical protein